MFGARVVRQKRERERAERGLLDADSRPTVPYIKVDTIATSASKSSIRSFVITEKAPTSAFSWVKAVSIVSYSRPSLMIIASRLA